MATNVERIPEAEEPEKKDQTAGFTDPPEHEGAQQNSGTPSETDGNRYVDQVSRGMNQWKYRTPGRIVGLIISIFQTIAYTIGSIIGSIVEGLTGFSREEVNEKEKEAAILKQDKERYKRVSREPDEKDKEGMQKDNRGPEAKTRQTAMPGVIPGMEQPDREDKAQEEILPDKELGKTISPIDIATDERAIGLFEKIGIIASPGSDPGTIYLFAADENGIDESNMVMNRDDISNGDARQLAAAIYQMTSTDSEINDPSLAFENDEHKLLSVLQASMTVAGLKALEIPELLVAREAEFDNEEQVTLADTSITTADGISNITITARNAYIMGRDGNSSSEWTADFTYNGKTFGAIPLSILTKPKAMPVENYVNLATNLLNNYENSRDSELAINKGNQSLHFWTDGPQSAKVVLVDRGNGTESEKDLGSFRFQNEKDISKLSYEIYNAGWKTEPNIGPSGWINSRTAAYTIAGVISPSAVPSLSTRGTGEIFNPLNGKYDVPGHAHISREVLEGTGTVFYKNIPEQDKDGRISFQPEKIASIYSIGELYRQDGGDISFLASAIQQASREAMKCDLVTDDKLRISASSYNTLEAHYGDAEEAHRIAESIREKFMEAPSEETPIQENTEDKVVIPEPDAPDTPEAQNAQHEAVEAEMQGVQLEQDTMAEAQTVQPGQDAVIESGEVEGQNGINEAGFTENSPQEQEEQIEVDLSRLSASMMGNSFDREEDYSNYDSSYNEEEQQYTDNPEQDDLPHIPAEEEQAIYESLGLSLEVIHPEEQLRDDMDLEL